MGWSIASDGTVVVVDVVVVAPFTVAVVFGAVVVALFTVVAVLGTVVVTTVADGTSGADSITTLFLPTVGATVVAIANVVVTIWVLIMGRSAPLTVVFKLARPWNTAKIFLDVALSRSGTMTAASSIICPIPGMV